MLGGLGPRARAEPDLLDGGVAGSVGQAAQDAALRHLEAGSHRGDAGQHGGETRHVRLHVAQQLLQLVQDWGGRQGGGEAGTRTPRPVLSNKVLLPRDLHAAQRTPGGAAPLSPPSQYARDLPAGQESGFPNSFSQAPRAAEMTAGSSDPTLGFPPDPRPASWRPGRSAALATPRSRAPSRNFSQTARATESRALGVSLAHPPPNQPGHFPGIRMTRVKGLNPRRPWAITSPP